MDFQNNTNNYPPQQIPNEMPGQIPFPRPVPPRENELATAAMATGIIGALSLFLLPFFLPCLFGSISIILAFLSRGSQPRLSMRAKIGCITSACSIVLNALILFSCFYLIFSVPEFTEQFNQAYEQMYGESFDDALEDAMDAE